MRIFTEMELQERYRKKPFAIFNLPANCKLTPAAVQFLQDKRIKVETGENHPPVSNAEVNLAASPRNTKGYRLPDGKAIEQKPEHMTQLRGKDLVDKRHPVIRLRGKLDSLQAQIIETIIDLQTMGFSQIAEEMSEILKLSRALMRAEVTGEQLPAPTFAGLDAQAIREFSHYPEKHIGVKHFLPDPSHGRFMSRLNIIRTLVRETELIAADVFCQEDGTTSRGDIMQTLNRMSSMIYMMMCQLKAGKYDLGSVRE